MKGKLGKELCCILNPYARCRKCNIQVCKEHISKIKDKDKDRYYNQKPRCIECSVKVPPRLKRYYLCPECGREWSSKSYTEEGNITTFYHELVANWHERQLEGSFCLVEGNV